MAKESQPRIRLWPKNWQGLKEMVDHSGGLLSVNKIANFAIACYLNAKKGKGRHAKN